VADQMYFTDGDFYQCVTATSPGETPTNAPTKWRRINLLTKWRYALAQLTYANLLTLDGQGDKAGAARNAAYGREKFGLDDMVRIEARDEEARDRAVDRGNRASAVGTGRSLYIKARVVLDDAYRLIGWDADQLDERDKSDARMCLSQALQEVWEAWWWTQLMTCARTQFAGNWLGDENYPDPCYYPPTDAYYIPLNDSLGAPVDADGVTQPRWVKFSGAPWPTWLPGSYAEDAYVNHNGQGYYATAPTTGVPGDSADWSAINEWTPILPDPNSDTVGQVFGPIRGVSKHDPRTNCNPEFFELNVTSTGTQVQALTVTHPWVWSRRVTPVLTGDDYSATATYEATPTENLVFDS